MIEFGILTGKNIMSYGSGGFELDLSACKLTLIQGKNGASKSSIIEALTYCLFGKPYRNIKIGQLVNSINGKGLLTTLEFKSDTDTFKVIRGIKPNIFEIYKNGELIPEEAASRDYQKILEETILGFGYKTFKQVCVIGSASYTQFMSLSANERRSMTEEMLDVSVFSRMAAIIKDMISTIKRTLEQIDTQLLSKQGESKRLVGLLAEMQESETVKKAEYKQQIELLEAEQAQLNAKIDQLTSFVSELTEKMIGHSELNTEYSDTKDSLRDFMSQIEAAKKTKKFFEDNDNCSVCRQSITEDHKNEIIERENLKIQGHMKSSKELYSFMENAKTKLDEFAKFADGISTANSKIKEISLTKSHNERSIASMNKELNRTNDSDKVSNQISEVGEQLIALTDKKAMSLTDKEYHDACAMMLKDTGIKANIIATYIPLINESINRYLEMFDLFVNFELDENFNETIKSRHRDAFTYDSFSEGEKSKIDLSILFTWREIARRKNSVACNLLFFDETLDSSLDSDSISSFLDMLRDQEDSNILIISHRGADPVLFDRCLMVEKRSDGFSRIAETE